MLDITFSTNEEGKEKLKQYIGIRDQMGGNLYWNICNDDCIKLTDALMHRGVTHREIAEIIV